MKSISLHELLIGPMALICTVVVFVAAIFDVPQDAIRARIVAVGASR